MALEASTGKLLWYYQMIHHDIWDWDNVAAPQLATVNHNGKKVDIVAEAGKTGFLYVFDRVTGTPLWPIEEKPVPQTDFPGEHTSPTQPIPTVVLPFSEQTFTADDVNPYILSDEERAKLKARIAAAKNGPIFTPPGWGDTIQMPATAAEPTGAPPAPIRLREVYVAAYNAPAILHMTDEAPGAPKVLATTSGAGTSGLELYSANCAVCHGASRAGDVGPSLIDINNRRTVESIKAVIQGGQGRCHPSLISATTKSTPSRSTFTARISIPCRWASISRGKRAGTPILLPRLLLLSDRGRPRGASCSWRQAWI